MPRIRGTLITSQFILDKKDFEKLRVVNTKKYSKNKTFPTEENQRLSRPELTVNRLLMMSFIYKLS